MTIADLTPADRLSLVALLLAGGDCDPGGMTPKMTPAVKARLVKAGLARDESTAAVPAVRAAPAVEAAPAVQAVRAVPYKAAVPAKGKTPAKPEVQAVAAVRARPAVVGRPAVAARAAIPARKRVVATSAAAAGFLDVIALPLVGKAPKKEDALVLADLVSRLQAVVSKVGVGFEEIAGPLPKDRPRREDVEAAYAKVKKGSGIARLSALRQELSAFERGEVDALLVALHEGGGYQLMREDDQRSLTDEDREAALPYKGERMHIVMRVS